ncbi:MAG: hypothetical protein LKM30_01370 [Bacilli bacterium]|nr:hypothetical protein [Bacilli bacterium]
MIFIRYEPPDGQMRHQHLFNGGNGQGIVRLYHRHGRKRIPVDEIRCQNVGCEYGEYQKE